MRLTLPDPSLIVLMGVSGVGKSTFAARHFRETAILSSDRLRAWITDDEADQGATSDAFTLLHMLVDRRLAHRRLCVIDATNVQGFARAGYLSLARRHRLPAVALVLDLSLEVCQRRAAARARRVAPEIIAQQAQDLRAALPMLSREGFQAIHLLREAQIEGVVIDLSPARPHACPNAAP
ncbi:AAA family ATPase [Myxococcota bacterium]|nr:AAA family ATPase [Myxococcota bacterium]MBU1431950.1 AAA family ATPase [Myxococcota bacterium]MBU1898818.1 AAA family ATPase [Myxococcota bacterium]